MEAEKEIRANRRFRELRDQGMDISREQVENNLTGRDVLDSTREISPLKMADDALLLDNSSMNQAEQLRWALDAATKRING